MEAPLYFKVSTQSQLVGSILIAICCLAFYSKRQTFIRALGIYATLSVIFSIAQSIALASENAQGIVNPIGNGFVLFEAILLGVLYYLSTINKSLRMYVLVSLIGYIAFYVFVFTFFHTQSFSLIRFGRDFIMLNYAIGYFYYLIKELPESKLLNFPMFWINASIIIFFSGTLILSFMRDYLVNVLKSDMTGFWAFRNFFRFAFCLVLAYAGWLDWKRVKLKVKGSSQ